MASTYDKTKDPTIPGYNFAPTLRKDRAIRKYPKGKAVTPSDTVDMAAYAPLVVTAAGNLKVLPAQNDDADTVTFTGLAVGYEVPFIVRRVYATGTTATVATLDAI